MGRRRLEALVVGKHAERLAVLEVALPGKARALAQILYVLCVLVAPEFTAGPAQWPTWIGAAVLAALGVVLVRPWHRNGLSAPLRILMGCGVVALVLASFASNPRGLLQSKPRIGVALEKASAEPGDPPWADTSGLARVLSVRPGSPAAGQLRPGDRIVALDGKPLDRKQAVADVVRRSREPGELTGPETTFRILRGHRELTLHLALPSLTPAGSGRSFFFELSARDMCLLGLALLIVISDGQRPGQIGLARSGLGRELGFGLLVLLGTYAVHLAAALPLSALAFAIGAGKAETIQRTEFLGELVGWAEQVRLWEIPLYMGLAGAFEEVVFRGFLITRMRRLFGSWTPALVLSAVLFGLGHLEEGTIAALQTAILGLWFGLVFLRRKRLESVIVAHAAFNTIMFAIMIFVLQSGLLDKAMKLIGQ